MHKQELPYEEWLKTIPPAFTEDTLWHLEVYRRALYFSDLAWRDLERVRTDHPALFFLSADQLYGHLCKIGAKIAFGFSIPFGTAQQNAYHESLDSTHEMVKWYNHCRPALTDALVEERLALLNTIIHHLTVLTQVPTWLLFRHFKEQECEFSEPHYPESLLDAVRAIDAQESEDELVAYLLGELDLSDEPNDDSQDDHWWFDPNTSF